MSAGWGGDKGAADRDCGVGWERAEGVIGSWGLGERNEEDGENSLREGKKGRC